MKTPKIGLLGKILTAIVVGIGLGLVVPEWTVRTFITFNGIFSQFLGFAIPLIIALLMCCLFVNKRMAERRYDL